jgi:4-hydroxy-tetrahydrodipicolinate synthase
VIEAFLAGDIELALKRYRELLPVYRGVFATQGCLLVKAGLSRRGFPDGGVRAPLLPATAAQTDAFVALLDSVGV